MSHILVKDLRDAVLQAAIQGKLTKKIPSDSSTDDLLKSINSEIKILAKEKKFRIDNTYDEIVEDEISFEVPKHWKCLRLGKILSLSSGKGLTSKQYKPGNIPVYGGNGINGMHNESNVPAGTIIIGRVGFYCGSIHITNTPAWVTDNGLIVTFPTCINKEFLVIMLKALKLGTNTNQTAQPVITGKQIKPIIVALPPIEEQQRIVDKVNELMAKIDEYEKLENQLVKLKEEFPENMKDAILQAAFEGKLSKQNNSESLEVSSDIFESDIELHNIPSNWKWVKINNAIDVKTGLSFTKTDQLNSEKGTLRILRGGNINDAFEYKLYDNDVYVDINKFKSKYIPLKEGDVITPSVTSLEKMCKTGYIDKDMEDVTAGGFVYIMRAIKGVILPKYLLYFVSSPFHRIMCTPNIRKSGQAFYNLRKSGLVEQPIPLPPIEEQQRIVELLDKLLPLVEGLVDTK